MLPGTACRSSLRAKLNILTILILTTSDVSITGHQEPQLCVASTHTRKDLQPPLRTCVGHDVDLRLLLGLAGIETRPAAHIRRRVAGLKRMHHAPAELEETFKSYGHCAPRRRKLAGIRDDIRLIRRSCMQLQSVNVMQTARLFGCCNGCVCVCKWHCRADDCVASSQQALLEMRRIVVEPLGHRPYSVS